MKTERILQSLMLMGVLLLLTVSAVLAQGGGVTISILNVRSGPGTEYESVTQISDRVRVIIEGRNDIGDWVMIRSEDSAIRGWVASRYVNFDDGVELASLPVVNEIANDELAGDEGVVDPGPAPENPRATLIGNATIYIGPSELTDSSGEYQAGTEVNVEGRDRLNLWVMTNTESGLRGWVGAQFVQLEGYPIESLTVVEVFDDSVSQLSYQRALPEESPDQMRARLQSIPVLHNMASSAVRNIYYRGLGMGNRPNVFMKVGDSITATQPFMQGFGTGDYNLGPYSYLQPTVNFFANTGAGNSFVATSLAAQSGFTAPALFDALWVNPAVCRDVPLYCEYELTKPSVAIILLGAVDMRTTGLQNFQQNLYKIVDQLIQRGVIPVITTFANHPGIMEEEALRFNTININAAQEYNLPVINLWLATQSLPDAGIKLDDPIHMTQGDNFFHFDAGQEAQYGVSLRNLLTLQALHELRVNVMQ